MTDDPKVFLPEMTFAEVEDILDQVELAILPTGSNLTDRSSRYLSHGQQLIGHDQQLTGRVATDLFKPRVRTK